MKNPYKAASGFVMKSYSTEDILKEVLTPEMVIYRNEAGWICLKTMTEQVVSGHTYKVEEDIVTADTWNTFIELLAELYLD